MADKPVIKAVAFDAYGTLFDVYSVGVLAEELFPGQGAALAELWRDRQIEYTRIRTLCDRYADFWSVTGDALDFACERLDLPLTNEARDRLMGQYAKLPAFPENRGVLQALRQQGIPLAILSNGSPDMLASAVAAADMSDLFDHLLSVDAVRKFKTAPGSLSAWSRRVSAARRARSPSCPAMPGMSAVRPGSAIPPSGSTGPAHRWSGLACTRSLKGAR